MILHIIKHFLRAKKHKMNFHFVLYRALQYSKQIFNLLSSGETILRLFILICIAILRREI